MKFITITLVTVFFVNLCYCQNIKSHGTYIISCITKMGIVVGADSKDVSFESDEHSRIYSYVEGAQKIFSYNNVFIQMAGQYSFDNYTFLGLINLFKKSNLTNISVRNFRNVFLDFAKKKLNNNDFKTLVANQMIISGFNNLTPCIFYYENNFTDSAIGRGFKDNYHSSGFQNFFDTASINTMKFFIKNLIKNMSKTQPKIGGKISFGYLTFNNQKHEEFQTKNGYLTTKDLMYAELNDKTGRIYMTKKDSIIYKLSVRDFINAHFK